MVLNWKRFAGSGWFQRAKSGRSLATIRVLSCVSSAVFETFGPPKNLLFYLKLSSFSVTLLKFLESTFIYTATASHKIFPNTDCESHGGLLDKLRVNEIVGVMKMLDENIKNYCPNLNRALQNNVLDRGPTLQDWSGNVYNFNLSRSISFLVRSLPGKPILKMEFWNFN
jgi:hypothetical protein